VLLLRVENDHRLSVAEQGLMGLGMIYTAMPVTNAVPAVVAARPASRRWPTCPS